MASTWRDLLPDELVPEAHVGDLQVFHEEGPSVGQPGPGSTKVGWTMRSLDGRILYGFAFLLNPQGITRTAGSRAQLFATKGANIVDDFGPGAGVITLRQYIAAGKVFAGGAYTMREDYQRFLTTIFLPATQSANRGVRRVFFHDNHLERGLEEEIYFPPDCLTLERTTDDLIWRATLQMVSLSKYPYDEITPDKSSKPPGANVRRYVVSVGDTIEGLARRLAGAGASTSKIAALRGEVLRLNPQLKHKRTLPDGATGKPLRVYRGETILLPA